MWPVFIRERRNDEHIYRVFRGNVGQATEQQFYSPRLAPDGHSD
jgi:hypothetical protein